MDKHSGMERRLERLGLLIDCEGSIYLSRGKKTVPDGYEVGLSISMADTGGPGLVDEAAATLEAVTGKRVSIRCWTTPRGTLMRQLVLSGRIAALAIAQLVPWLTEKQPLAVAVLRREHARMMLAVGGYEPRISLRPYLRLVGADACWSLCGDEGALRASLRDATEEALRGVGYRKVA